MIWVQFAATALVIVLAIAGAFAGLALSTASMGGRTNQNDIQLDGAAMTGRNQHGHVIALRPFMGVMGMPPDEPGLHSTSPPRVWGGI